MSENTLPTSTLELRSTVADDGSVTLAMNETEVPMPGPNEVVVRIEAAPINPSDLGMLFAGADIGTIEAVGSSDLPAARAMIPTGSSGLAGRLDLSLIHISEPTRHICLSRMPSSA